VMILLGELAAWDDLVRKTPLGTCGG